MKENKNLEFKSAVTNSFLKTVSAYSNFGEGMILFGVNDDGSVCGIKNLQQTCLDIENRINDSIIPKPDFEIETDDLQNIIRLINIRDSINHIYIKEKHTGEVIQRLWRWIRQN